jgi:hypothetical protein
MIAISADEMTIAATRYAKQFMQKSSASLNTVPIGSMARTAIAVRNTRTSMGSPQEKPTVGAASRHR